MKKNLPKKLLSLILSGMLIVTGLDMTAVHAAEATVSQESTADSLNPETESLSITNNISEESSSRQETENIPSEVQTETASSELQNEEISSEMLSVEASSEMLTEQTSSEMLIEEASYEISTEEASSEMLTEETASETEQTDDTTSDEVLTEETTTSISEEETEERTTMESIIVVNPLYKDIIDPDELAAELDAQESINLLADERAASSFQTYEEAVQYLRGQMTLRVETVSIQVPVSISEEHTDKGGFAKTLLADAVAHTEECSGQEGDALQWQYGGSGMNMSSNGSIYTVDYQISYYTTLNQEQELDAKVDEALSSMALSGKSDYQKVKAIHDYICDNVNYDYENLENEAHKVKFTAYGALCTGKAVCQGYAVAFYRLCKEAGLPVRIITGTGNGGPHAWNIVKIGNNTRAAGEYYNIDCTWDGQDEETYDLYFLKNEKEFGDHTRAAEYNTTEFHAQYPMSATSYVDESSLPAGLNKENPNATFTTIDDQTVSSAADGKPKMLIFFQTECGNSQRTIKAIAEQGFPGVDIYAGDIYKHSKDQVATFKNNYGSDAITFLYDTELLYGTNAQINLDMFEYAKAGGLTDGNSMSVALPMICYIDANNVLQCITQGIQQASQIEANLKNYCGSTAIKQYKITYELNGGTNHNENPAAFKENSDAILLKDPTREGFTFAGWYLDNAFTQKVTQIDKGTAQDITLYAKWSSSGASDKLNIDNPEHRFTTIDEETVLSTAEGRPKVLIFFSHVCGKSQQTIRDIAVKGVPNADIYAIETNKASLAQVQSFKSTYGNGNDAIIYSYDPYGFQNNNTANDYVDLAGTNDFAPPIICYIDANNKFQHITNGTSSASAVRNNIDLYCNGASTEDPDPSDTYTITYELNGGTNNTANPDTYTAQTETIILRAPVKEGCTFAGWYRDKTLTISITQIVKGSTGDLTLYAKWKDNSQEPVDPPETYTITYKLDGGTNHADNPASYAANTETITLKAPAKEGYTFDGWYTDAAMTNKITQITKDNTGNLTLYAKWTKNQTSDDSDTKPGDSDTTVEPKYTVTFNMNGHGSAPQSITDIQSGELIQKPADPTAQGYRFDGWYKDSSCSTAWNFNTDKVTADTTLYAKWIKLDAPADEDVSKYPADQRKDLKAAGAKIAEIKAKVYDGSPYTPTVKVTASDNGKQITLTEGVDYRVLYTNNVVPGTAKVTVRGNGTYKGEITKEFQITKKPLKDLNIVAGGMSADAKTDNLPVYIYDGAVELVKGTDYTLSNLTDVKGSSAKVTATAAKSSKYYEGSVTTKVTLYKADADKIINADNVTLSAKSVPFTGKAVTSVVPTVKIGNVTLEKNKQYKVQYKDNTKAGTALVIITGKGQYKGKVIKSFTIEPSKSKFTVSSISDKTYNGKLQKPSVTVKDGTKKLKVNRDYTVTYAKNLSAGKATVTITGIGNYAGSAPVTTTFTIKSQKISKASVKGTVSKGITLTYNKKPLVEGVDYKLTYGAVKNGKTQVTITGIGDFTDKNTKMIKN